MPVTTSFFGLSGILPEAVEVWFPAEVSDPEDPSWFVVRVTLAASGADVGSAAGFLGTKTFRDSMIATSATLPDPGTEDPVGVSTTGDYPGNRPALVDLAVQIAKDYYLWRRVSSDEVFNGPLNWLADGLVELEVHVTADDCRTRASTGPWDDSPEELFHQSPDVPLGDMLYAVVTTTCLARTGSLAAGFTFGKGKGLLLNLRKGVAKNSGWSRVLFNGYKTAMPARDDPYFLKKVQGHLCIGTGDC